MPPPANDLSVFCSGVTTLTIGQKVVLERIADVPYLRYDWSPLVHVRIFGNVDEGMEEEKTGGAFRVYFACPSMLEKHVISDLYVDLVIDPQACANYALEFYTDRAEYFNGKENRRIDRVLYLKDRSMFVSRPQAEGYEER